MYIGIDWGKKRVGIALSDEGERVAFPLEIVPEREALERVATLIKERGITGVVIGESKDLKGKENPIMQHIRSFAAVLEGTCPIFFEPEFMTSIAAQRPPGGATSPIANTRGRGERKNGPDDASAAALILQSFLDKRGRVE
ncbi:MAG: Holliday junction resolvase RuvX [Patescibacteria group bacterium]|nr:Holliday junction resolvase RuvX [Patescibacteria group bacterium]